jgi:hypothetical protein
MTAAQRRKQSRENGRKSRGPVSEAGREISKRNSLRHGLTAKVLALPDEDPEQIQIQAELWFEALQPECHDEEVLVDHLAVGALQIERGIKARTEILAEQTRNTEIQWDLKRKRRLLKLRRKLDDDPAKTLLYLRAFGLGVAWLLARWRGLEAAFQKGQGWNDVRMIREAIRLRGGDEARIDEAAKSGRDFALFAVLCVDDFQTKPELVHFLQGYSYSADWLAKIDARVYSPTEARRTIRMCIEQQIADLRELDRHFREVDAQSRAGAKARAGVLADTPQNRLLIRYMKSNESSFDRTLKTLKKIQKDRQKEAETEAKQEAAEARKAGLRNEPSVVARPRSKDLYPGSYVKMLGKDYVVTEKSDGNVILSEVERSLEAEPSEVASPSENAA